MTLLIGCIADDITGASDLGLMLATHGMPTTLFLGVPDANRLATTPAIVIALKIRTCPAREAVKHAVAAANELRARGARQLFYKYCSTFDSTAAGNIGPVSDALLNFLDADQTVLLPAFPENGRTVRDGHLFVGDVPLSESPMRNHPLTPMTDSFLPSLMDAQTAEGKTGWVSREIVASGADAIRAELDAHRRAGRRYVSIDSQDATDLQTIADATVDLELITGGSGIAAAMPDTLRRKGLLEPEMNMASMPALAGNAAVLAGSCSQATRVQVATFEKTAIPIIVDPVALYRGTTTKEELAARALSAAKTGDVLIYSSADAGQLLESQSSMGIEASAQLVEDTLAFVARSLSDDGIRKFIVAGGETSGAVAQALNADEFEIGPQIAPGVPWLCSRLPQPTCIAFKSGNFGQPDFFQRALDLLP